MKIGIERKNIEKKHDHHDQSKKMRRFDEKLVQPSKVRNKNTFVGRISIER